MRAAACVCLLVGGLLSACGDGTSPAGPTSLRDMGSAGQTAGQSYASAGQATESPGGGGSGNGGSAASANAGNGSAGNPNAGHGNGGSAGLTSEPQLWEKKRAAFLEVIGRPQVPLDVQETPKGGAGALLVEDFSIQSDASTRINGTSYRPGDAGPYPAVIYLHGTGGDRNSDNAFNRDLAGRGFFVVTIDARYHGQGQGTGAYFDAIYGSYLSGNEHPFLYDTVWDVMRLIDYLEQRSDVDAERVGLVGSSKGGMETYLTAAVEPRVKVAAPWIGVQNWAWALDNDAWQARVGSIQGAVDQAANHDGVAPIDADYVRKFYDRAVPGIYQEFDAIEMLPAIAPRPLLVINGETDARNPLTGVRLIETATSAVYAASGAAEKFVLRVQPATGHSVTQASFSDTLDWFAQHLAP